MCTVASDRLQLKGRTGGHHCDVALDDVAMMSERDGFQEELRQGTRNQEWTMVPAPATSSHNFYNYMSCQVWHLPLADHDN